MGQVVQQNIILQEPFFDGDLPGSAGHKGFPDGSGLPASPVDKGQLMSPIAGELSRHPLNQWPVVQQGVGQHGQGKINGSPAGKRSETKSLYRVFITIVKDQFGLVKIDGTSEFKEMADPCKKGVPVEGHAGQCRPQAPQDGL